MSKANETVWVSDSMGDTRLIKAFTPANFEQAKDRLLQAMRLNEKGVALPADHFPKEMYFNYRDKKVKRINPGFFYGGGFHCVSAAFADVLRRFDLGKGALYPVELFQHDRETPVEGEYFCINFGNQKQAAVPEYSPKLMKPSYPQKEGEPPWILPAVLENNDITVTKSALEKPDLWVDPQIRESLFLSDPLAKVSMSI
ncbi:hypothetical protein [Profundibacter sp.]|uniref:hypothetical protein n=1 Tax=Profundibacter sp. TaxID=3101071 RepID=UPI003D09D5F7